MLTPNAIDIRAILEIELARAEAVVEASSHKNKKAHQPTVDIHRGMVLAIEKVLAVLDKPTLPTHNEGELLEWYVLARVDGWQCKAPMSQGDHWKQALLTRQRFVAEIDIPRGTLSVWTPNKTQIENPIPYRDYPLTQATPIASNP